MIENANTSLNIAIYNSDSEDFKKSKQDDLNFEKWVENLPQLLYKSP